MMSLRRKDGVTRRRRLPPLSITSPSSTADSTSSVEGRPLSPWPVSRYHRNCLRPSRALSPGPGEYMNLQRSSSVSSFRPVSSKPGMFRNVKGPSRESDDGGLNLKKVSEFLTANLVFLENYVIEKVDLDDLKKWTARKTQILNKRSQSAKSNSGTTSTRISTPRSKVNKIQVLKSLTDKLFNKPDKVNVLSELTQTIASALNAIAWKLYLCNASTEQISIFDEKERVLRSLSENEMSSPAEEVVKSREPVRTKLDKSDVTYPDVVVDNTDVDSKFVLCHPLFQAKGELSAILEFYRTESLGEFMDDDMEVVRSYLVWGELALHYSELYLGMVKQRTLSNFLLEVVRSIFQDMVSMDAVIIKIMGFARTLVKADRASLFLMDSRTKELYARIFDVSGNQSEQQYVMDKEIRFPVGKGIAGFVALTGQALNIPNAYDDSRFNRSVDQRTGYTTRNLLCMPIFIRNTVIGVVQMVNKDGGCFSKEDEEAFSTFSLYCGLALHHAKLYDKIRRSEQKHKVAMEVLAYHNTCTAEDVETIKNASPPVTAEQLMAFDFSHRSLNADEKVVSTVVMFTNLFGLKNFDLDCLIRFVFTVRKNYRRVPYHNWGHGFSVANAAFAVIKRAPGVFRPLEELSLFVSCLCHDLDHRGTSNQFLANSSAPLAAIYTTSTLEHHHFNQTVSILQQDGHNILQWLSNEEYKQILGNIKHCILATDLARFFPNKEKLAKLLDEDQLNWNNSEHRLIIQAVAMTAFDLCANTKPFEQQKNTVSVIFEEFYQQGDAERNQGREPIPMMDRNKKDDQSKTQVGFIEGICVPCYTLLHKVIPQSQPMIEGCLKNLELWKKEIEEAKAKNTSN